MLTIEKPRIQCVNRSADDTYAHFEVEPLERGYGTTLGNSLRRVLLSSLPGVAVTTVKIDGVLHEFSTIPGVREDTTDIILALKKLCIRMHGQDDLRVLRIEAEGEGEVTAGNILAGADIEILNPDLHLATLDKDGRLYMEIPGNRLSDIAHAIQRFAEARGFTLVREYCGHGIGQALHEEPQVPNYGPPGQGPVLEAGMVLAIEPMVNAGRCEVESLEDGWTVVTVDRRPSVHFEHTVAITTDGPVVLTGIE